MIIIIMIILKHAEKWDLQESRELEVSPRGSSSSQR